MGRGKGNPRDILLSKKRILAPEFFLYTSTNSKGATREIYIDSNGDRAVRLRKDRGDWVERITTDAGVEEIFAWRDDFAYDRVGDGVVVKKSFVALDGSEETLKIMASNELDYFVRDYNQRHQFVYKQKTNNSWHEIYQWEDRGDIYREEEKVFGTRKTISHYKNNNLHSTVGPAETVTEDGKVVSEAFFKEGKLHRAKDLPAKITTNYEERKPKIISEWYQNGKRHRKNAPAFVIDSGSDSEARYYTRDQEYNPSGEATRTIRAGREITEYFYHLRETDGQKEPMPGGEDGRPYQIIYIDDEKVEETWFCFESTDSYLPLRNTPEDHPNNLENRPAKRTYSNGVLVAEEYICDSKHHRTDGPAIVRYSPKGEPIVARYFFRGDQMSKEEWESKIKS